MTDADIEILVADFINGEALDALYRVYDGEKITDSDIIDATTTAIAQLQIIRGALE